MNRLQKTFAALGVRDFRLLWSGSLLSVTAFMTSFVLVPAIGYELTGSYLGGTIAAMGSGISQVLFGPFGGVVADRYPKKPLVMAGQLLPGLIIAGIGILIVTGQITIWLLLCATLIMGVSFSVMGPARQAWTGEMVPKKLLANAVALQQMAMNIGQVLGPMLILGVIGSFLDAGYLYLTVACFFAIVLPLTSMIRSKAPPRDRPPRSVVSELGEGIRYLSGNPRLRILWAYFLTMVACGFAFQSLLSAFQAEEFGRDPLDLSLILTVFGFASIFVNIPLANIVGGRFAWPALLGMGVLMAIGLWLVALAPNYGTFVALAAFIGAGRSGAMLVNQSTMMSNTRPEYFGRVMSLVMMGFGFQSLLAPVWGALADSIGARQTFTLIGLIAATATVLMAIGWLRTRNLPLEQGTAAAESPATPSVVRPAATATAAGPPPPVPAFVQQAAPVVLMEGQKSAS